MESFVKAPFNDERKTNEKKKKLQDIMAANPLPTKKKECKETTQESDGTKSSKKVQQMKDIMMNNPLPKEFDQNVKVIGGKNQASSVRLEKLKDIMHKNPLPNQNPYKCNDSQGVIEWDLDEEQKTKVDHMQSKSSPTPSYADVLSGVSSPESSVELTARKNLMKDFDKSYESQFPLLNSSKSHDGDESFEELPSFLKTPERSLNSSDDVIEQPIDLMGLNKSKVQDFLSLRNDHALIGMCRKLGISEEKGANTHSMISSIMTKVTMDNIHCETIRKLYFALFTTRKM